MSATAKKPEPRRKGRSSHLATAGTTEKDGRPLTEFELIEKILAPLAKRTPGALSLMDDAALISSDGPHEIVVTCDAIVEGVHFRPADPPDLVGRKLLRINLSDLAAMGAAPLGYVLTLALPHDRGTPWIEHFAKGLAADQEAFGVGLYGGDTVATPGPLTLSLTAFGRVAKGSALLRSGATVGDLIYVSGTIGDGLLGLGVLEGELAQLPSASRDHLARCYQVPEPRLELGRRLAGVANAALDVSDGLVADMAHICDASGVGAEIDLDSIPISEAAAQALDLGGTSRLAMATGGDDYELLFTARPDRGPDIKKMSTALGLRLTKIGRIVDDRGVRLLDSDGATISVPRPGYTHF